MAHTGTKARILDAALDLFSVNGFEGVSVKQIAGAVGIKDSSLYKHFNSKREIFDTLLADMNARFDQMTASYRLPQGGIEEVAKEYGSNGLIWLKTACKAVFLFLLKDPKASKFRRMLTIEQYKNKDAAFTVQNWFTDDAIKFQTALFEEMIRQGYFKTAPAQIIALQFYAPFYVLLSQYDTRPEREEEALELLMGHIEQFAEVYQVKGGEAK